MGFDEGRWCAAAMVCGEERAVDGELDGEREERRKWKRRVNE